MTGERLRIAMTSYYLPSDSKIGVGFQVDAIANALVERGHEVTVFSPCGPVLNASYIHRQVPITGSMRTFRWANALRRLRFDDFDVLHAHGDDHLLWRRRASAHIRTLHGSCFEEAIRIKGVKERLRMLLLGFTEVAATFVADVTVVVSPATRRWTPWVRRVIPNGVDLRRFHPGHAKSEDPSILFVGTWLGRKRGKLLAEIFERDVRPQLPNATLWMVTRDAPDEVPPGVEILGELSDADLSERYQRAWAFCLPSSYEGFGIPYAEALASGLPVVASPNVGARYVTGEGTVGLLSDDSSLGQTLVDLLKDESRRSEMTTRGLEQSQQFSLTRVAESYEALYREVIAQRSSRRG